MRVARRRAIFLPFVARHAIPEFSYIFRLTVDFLRSLEYRDHPPT